MNETKDIIFIAEKEQKKLRRISIWDREIFYDFLYSLSFCLHACAFLRLENHVQKDKICEVWFRGDRTLGLILPTCLLKAFTLSDPKSAKRQSNHKCHLALLGSLPAKAAHNDKMLVKLNPVRLNFGILSRVDTSNLHMDSKDSIAFAKNLRWLLQSVSRI